MASCRDNLSSLGELLLYFAVERGEQVKFAMHVDEKAKDGPWYEASLVEWGWRYAKKLGKGKSAAGSVQHTIASQWGSTPNKAIEGLLRQFRT
jgi:hypothetical protein